MVLIFPPDFASLQAGGRPAKVQALIDGSNPLAGRYASTALAGYTASKSLELTMRKAEVQRGLTGLDSHIPVVTPEFRVFYNPRMKSPIFMVPGVAAMILLIVTTIATSMGLAREHEVGTLEQVMVTPIAPWQLILGKVLPFLILGCFDVLLVLTLAVWIFGVPVRWALLTLGLGTLFYILSTVGLGIFVSTIAKTQQKAFMIGIFVIMPAILLSGIMTPVFNMPIWLQPIAYANPIKYYVDILRGVLLKGSGFTDLWWTYVALLVFGVLIQVLAVSRFSKRMQ